MAPREGAGTAAGRWPARPALLLALGLACTVLRWLPFSASSWFWRKQGPAPGAAVSARAPNCGACCFSSCSPAPAASSALPPPGAKAIAAPS